MAFEELQIINPTNAKAAFAVPAAGILVRARALTLKNKTVTRFIAVKIGADLSRRVSLTADQHRLRLSFGTDEDAGKIMVSTDNETGKFVASRGKTGEYTFTINAATCDGLFATIFPPFTRDGLTASPGSISSAPRFIFNASPEMLAVDE